MKAPRIKRWYWKLLYIVASAIIVDLIALASDPSAAGDGTRGILRSAAVLVLTIIGARFFRGPHEDAVAPRAWWRMTAKWIAGLVIGAIWLLITVGSIGVALGQAGTLADGGTVQSAASVGVVGVILTFLYLGSGLRLLRESRRNARES